MRRVSCINVLIPIYVALEWPHMLNYYHSLQSKSYKIHMVQLILDFMLLKSIANKIVKNTFSNKVKKTIANKAPSFDGFYLESLVQNYH